MRVVLIFRALTFMEIKRCVVVIKKTALSQGGRAARFAHQGDVTARRLVRAHDEHNRTVEAVREVLASRGIESIEMVPHKFSPAERRKLASADLIVTVGGDGTLLGTSHYVTHGALIGVNSAPRDSIGHFCVTGRRGFARMLDDALSLRVRPAKLAKLSIALDGHTLAELALNDVLVAQSSPAATTRYIIGIGGKQEEQRSSGIWISTAAGSTAAIRSAGGRVLPLRSRRIQYLVREPYRERGRNYDLTRGTVPPGEEIIIASKMNEGRLYIDGSRTVYNFPFGCRARIRVADLDLRIFLKSRAGD